MLFCSILDFTLFSLRTIAILPPGADTDVELDLFDTDVELDLSSTAGTKSFYLKKIKQCTSAMYLRVADHLSLIVIQF